MLAFVGALAVLISFCGCALRPRPQLHASNSSASLHASPRPSVVEAARLPAQTPRAKTSTQKPGATVPDRLFPEVVTLGGRGADRRERAESVVPLPSTLRERAGGIPNSPSASAGPARDVEPSARSCVVVPDRREVREVLAEFTGPQRAVFVQALRRSGRYLPLIKAVLSEEDLPQELAYLSLVESHFSPDARSVSGALGLWQFMETTARGYGLRVDGWADERLDPEASTRAAARHLGDLYARFGDWNLAAAAYNAGAGGVGRAIDRHSAESFWDLHGAGALSGQTCRYVVKFLAAIAVAAEPASHGMDVAEVAPPLVYDTVWTSFPVDLATVARFAEVSEEEIKLLNPALLRSVTPPGVSAYPVRVPVGKGPVVARLLRDMPEGERLTFTTHQVRRGETLAGIARRYGTTASSLAAINGIGQKRLRPKQELVVGVRQSDVARRELSKPARQASDLASEARVHVVQPGETVWGIARQYGVAPTDVLRWNKRDRASVLRPGDRLQVSSQEG